MMSTNAISSTHLSSSREAFVRPTEGSLKKTKKNIFLKSNQCLIVYVGFQAVPLYIGG